MSNLAILPKYEAYKESGSEWLGDIPETWNLLSNKYIFKLKKNLVGKRSDEYELLSLTLRGIIKRDMENPEGKFPAEFNTYQEVASGDFVFCLFDVEETPRTVGLSSFNGMITGAYTVFEAISDFNKVFLYYFYLNLDSTKRLKPLYRGLRNTIPKDSFMGFKTFVPNFEQQTLIASFLDKKTAQIDDAIAIKELQISLLKERKQIIIQQAVTQGLDPNVPMKDSGVDWIGEIPEHWEVKALKFIAYMKSGETLSPDQFTETGFPAYGGNGLRGYTSTFTNDGDHILIGRQGALCGNVNYASGKFYASEHAIVVYPLNNEDTRWLGEAIRVADFNRLSQSAAQPGIAVNVIKNVLFPHPPLLEQAGISKHIVEAERNIHKSIEIFNLQIEKLKEYKTSLINSAVTGKIKITPEMVEQ
ncbi:MULTISPECIES: restriction endonuclease subunit S [Vibrio]|uniref:restriction endonuclease subunit S n=1 Tax=Vibrio TaxID=662 RepID=UPI0027D27278|nr:MULTISPECIES: restriction endonuclease subunit S [unclassified Vibrio]